MKVLVNVDVTKVVIVTDDHGGYKAGHCIACGKHGWLAEHPMGLRYTSKSKDNSLRHAATCPMNRVPGTE